MNFLLKVVEGPNKGAEIALVEGVAVTLGKDDDCDIVLADPTMPDAPLSVEASADGVVLGGEPLESLSVKTFGATSFAVGPADAPWGELKWPKPETADDSTESTTNKTTEPPNNLTTEQPNSQTTEPPNNLTTEPSNRRRSGCFGCLLILLALLLVLTGLAWFFRVEVKSYAESLWEKVRAGRSGADDSPAAQASSTDAQLSKLRDIAARYDISLVESDGQARLSGDLKTRRDRLAATAEAYEALPGVELDLSDDESLRATAENALFTLTEGALKVVAATNRVVSIAGASPSPLSLKKTLEALNADLPKLRNVDVSGVVISPGATGPKDDDGDMVSQKPSRSKTSRASKSSSPTLPVCGILTMPYPCLVMRDGRRIMEGAAIGDSVIVEIGADSVTLTNSTGRFTWKP